VSASRASSARAGFIYTSNEADVNRHLQASMTDPVINEAAKPNPALAPFEALVGAWTTVATHPMLPGTVFHGRATFRWLEQGAFLVMH
jgi:hypothetical protein